MPKNLKIKYGMNFQIINNYLSKFKIKILISHLFSITKLLEIILYAASVE